MRLRVPPDEASLHLVRLTAPLDRGYLLDVPVGRLRSSLGIRLFGGHHPYMVAAAAATETEQRDHLRDAYSRFQPRTAADVLGVTAAQAPAFADAVPLGFLMPWELGDPETRVRERTAWYEQEARDFGEALTIAEGANLFGPVSEAKLTLELHRLSALRASIAEAGYHRHDGDDGDVEGWMLTTHEGAWRVVVSRGQHRAASVAALGLPTLPVRITHQPIKRDDAPYWPQVQAGRITTEGARAVFDRVMRGDPPTLHSSRQGGLQRVATRRRA